jgi:hypothetical protein
MSFLDDAKKKLTEAVNEHGDRIKEGMDRAGRTIDEKTDGRYTEKIQRGTKAAGDALDNLRDDAAAPTPAPTPGQTPGQTPGPTPDPNAPPDQAPGEDPGGASEPGLPNDPTNPTG